MQIIFTIGDQDDLQKVKKFMEEFRRPIIFIENSVDDTALIAPSAGERFITSNPQSVQRAVDKLGWL
jgi:hypothetical protein